MSCLCLSNCKNSGATLKDDSHLLRVSVEQSVELTFDVPLRDLEKFQAETIGQESRKGI